MCVSLCVFFAYAAHTEKLCIIILPHNTLLTPVHTQIESFPWIIKAKAAGLHFTTTVTTRISPPSTLIMFCSDSSKVLREKRDKCSQNYFFRGLYTKRELKSFD